MPFRISCPNCGNTGSLPDVAVGKRLTCKKCRSRFTITEPGRSDSHSPAISGGLESTREGDTLELAPRASPRRPAGLIVMVSCAASLLIVGASGWFMFRQSSSGATDASANRGGPPAPGPGRDEPGMGGQPAFAANGLAGSEGVGSSSSPDPKSPPAVVTKPAASPKARETTAPDSKASGGGVVAADLPPAAKEFDRVGGPKEADLGHEAKYRRIAAAILADPEMEGVGLEDPMEVFDLLALKKNFGRDDPSSSGPAYDVRTKPSVKWFLEKYGPPQEVKPVKETMTKVDTFGVSNREEEFVGHVYGFLTVLEDRHSRKVVRLRWGSPPNGFLADVWQNLQRRRPERPALVAADPAHGIWRDNNWLIRVLAVEPNGRFELNGRGLKAGKSTLIVTLEVTALSFPDYEAPGATIQRRSIRINDMKVSWGEHTVDQWSFMQFKQQSGEWDELFLFLGKGKETALYPHRPRRIVRFVAIRDEPFQARDRARLRFFDSALEVKP